MLRELIAQCMLRRAFPAWGNLVLYYDTILLCYIIVSLCVVTVATLSVCILQALLALSHLIPSTTLPVPLILSSI